MFSGFGSNTQISSLTLPDFPAGFGASATDMSYMFSGFGSNTQISSLTLPEFPAGFGSMADTMTNMFSTFGAGSLNLSTITLPAFPSGFGKSATSMSYMFSYFANNISTNYKGTTIDWTKTLSFTDTVDTYNMFNNFNPGTNGSQILTACNSGSSNVYNILSNVDRPDGLSITEKCQPVQTFFYSNH
jgi:hypothetical protein